MDLPEPTFQVTPYGDVDAKQLKSLRDSFDTTSLLKLVDRLDGLQGRLKPIDGIRDDLLRLHGMAHTVLNGSPLTRPSSDLDIWEEAAELANEFRDLAEVFLQAAEQVEPLAELRPDQGD
ncbi:Tn3 family transposase post-transcriptional regulator TnpC [Chromobacterium violaceum]|uniref:Transposase n=1 Tax=Chromobacterium violaceum TaxID=536 RepID=A0AAX2M9H4_CHRVL|nr:Tn3 family transposase post-transcriptional regulator TnpC [Chromobacterium violaceum]OLZ73896.1 hypothetical protein BS642_20450 [Chromobacterium violaceum]STB63594.1 Uncharacterised protein [Chromobacterium violaceum]STB63875.1 Uncharacterised protein [Chromobacterium violaceum]SUX32623.1 Uncharacterised protein [Chromobacterium violaceum]